MVKIAHSWEVLRPILDGCAMIGDGVLLLGLRDHSYVFNLVSDRVTAQFFLNA